MKKFISRWFHCVLMVLILQSHPSIFFHPSLKQSLSPSSFFPSHAELIQKTNAILDRLDSLAKKLQPSKDLTLDVENDWDQFRKDLRKRVLALKKKIKSDSQTEELLSIVQSAYKITLSFLEKIFTTNFIQSKLFGSQRKEIEEVLIGLAQDFQDLVPLLNPNWRKSQKDWIDYHYTMMNGIHHEIAGHIIYILSTYDLFYLSDQKKELPKELADLREEVNRISVLLNYWKIAKRSKLNRIEEVEGGQPNQETDFPETNIFLIRTFIYELALYLEKVHEKVAQTIRQDRFRDFDEDIQKYFLMVQDLTEVCECFLSFYIKNLELPLVKMDFRAPVEKVVDQMREEMTSKVHIHFENQLPQGENFFIKGNKVALQQAIVNIVKNAHKHGKARKIEGVT